MKTLIAMILLSFLAACGTPNWTCQPDDLCPDAVPVKMPRSSLMTTEVSDRVAVVIERSLAYWQLPPDALVGWRVIFVEAPFTCGGDWVVGCCDYDSRTITVSLSSYPLLAGCIEVTPLIHEIGHLRITNNSHSEPEWCGMDEVYHSFAGTPECPGIENMRMEPAQCYGL